MYFGDYKAHTVVMLVYWSHCSWWVWSIPIIHPPFCTVLWV